MSLTKKNVVSIPFKVQYLLFSDIESFNEYNVNFVNIVLNSGKAWRDFYSTPGSISFIENGNQSSDGVFYATELKQFYPGTDAESDLAVKKLEHQKLILRVLFNDGDNRIIGSLISPARIKADIESSGKKSGITIITSKRSAFGSLFYDPDYIS
jgi:hypothetical protein